MSRTLRLCVRPGLITACDCKLSVGSSIRILMSLKSFLKLMRKFDLPLGRLSWTAKLSTFLGQVLTSNRWSHYLSLHHLSSASMLITPNLSRRSYVLWLWTRREPKIQRIIHKLVVLSRLVFSFVLGQLSHPYRRIFFVQVEKTFPRFFRGITPLLNEIKVV